MAFLHEIVCSKCRQTKNVSHAPGRQMPNVCDDCKKEEQADRKVATLESFKKMSVEDRLARLELDQYNVREQIRQMPRI